MKKFLLLVAAVLITTVSFAQSTKHALGLRLGNGVELQYEYNFSQKNFLKADLGLNGFGGGFFASATYNWNCFEWDWTPNVGKWYLSAGVGASVGAWGGFQLGVSGDVAFGMKFKGAPITLALDYRPTVYLLHNAWGAGWGGICLSCVYNF